LLDKYDVGYTAGSVEIRLQKHLAQHKGFTQKAKDWVVKYVQFFSTKAEAMAREKQIKNWKSRKMIDALIAE
jgi:putative endonuclease